MYICIVLKSTRTACAKRCFPHRAKVCAEDCSFDYKIDIQTTEKCRGVPLSALFSPLSRTFFVGESPQISVFQSVYQHLISEVCNLRRSRSVPKKARFACAKSCAEGFRPIIGTRITSQCTDWHRFAANIRSFSIVVLTVKNRLE